MNYKIDKQSAQSWVEIITGRLRQQANDLRPDRMLSVDEFTEFVALCVLSGIRDAAWFVDPPDTQTLIAASMGMAHACLQAIACEAPLPPRSQSIPKELVN
jgi:hypothetical protein